jgi:hypothetical protein
MLKKNPRPGKVGRGFLIAVCLSIPVVCLSAVYYCLQYYKRFGSCFTGLHHLQVIIARCIFV